MINPRRKDENDAYYLLEIKKSLMLRNRKYTTCCCAMK
jgi:hypothetical protein